MEKATLGQRFGSFVERVGHKIPDPIIIFMAFYPAAFLVTTVLGGMTFEAVAPGGDLVTYEIKAMYAAEHVRWIFDNALLENWLGYGNGVLGVIFIAMLGVGVAEKSGLFGALIKKAGSHLPQSLLPLLLIFMGIMSSIGTDVGYLVLIPLAGLLYAGLGRNPLIGMAAAFAGVSAGFSANLFPGPVDGIIGENAKVFAEAAGVPFINAAGEALNPMTMHHYFIITSTFVLAFAGFLVTRWVVEPRLDQQSFEIPEDIEAGQFELDASERKGLWASLWGTVVALAIIAALAFGPLAAYTTPDGEVVEPYLSNIILLIALFFVVVGVFFGVAAGKFQSVGDVVKAMVSQMNTMGYILVLTFFCYNFLGLLRYSGLGTYITFLGAEFLVAIGLSGFPVLLLIGFILVTALINIFIGGLTSKWMLLGPIFVPMLFVVNPAMTPDLVAAAFRVADSSTNIITPMMVYAGVILSFMRKYRPNMGFGDMLLIMLPYSITFLLVWTALLVGFFMLGIPLGY
jgi:aminobenzoyl-glutamate transport protein